LAWEGRVEQMKEKKRPEGIQCSWGENYETLKGKKKIEMVNDS